MKVISVRQPWAHAIIHLGKDVENRSRNVAGAYRGPLAIHVSTGSIDQFSYQQITRITGQPLSHTLWLGYIIGIVDLVDVHKWPCGHNSLFEACSKWAEASQVVPARGRSPIGMTHLVLANPRPLLYPMWAVGHLGLWDVPDDKILPRLEEVA